MTVRGPSRPYCFIMSAITSPLPDGRVNRIGERITGAAFVSLHLACFAAIATGVSKTALLIGLVLFWVRMFAITAGYHRYFSHRAFKTSRWFQFVLALLGASCAEKGPLWWAATHRRHHRFSDEEQDPHSPLRRGFFESHVGWILGQKHVDTDVRSVSDLAAYPELVWLGSWHLVPAIALAIGCLAVAGWSGLVVGFVWSTVALWHATFTINSLAHVFGKRRFATTDTSRNNWLLALLTMGEGWHNNHHHYMNSANQGFYWWEIDVSYYVLRLLAAVGLIWDLRKVPPYVLERDRIDVAADDASEAA
jgi:stearoyl-CoA desaturase (delta-9 desaturase)